MLREWMHVAGRVLGNSDALMYCMRYNYSRALYLDDGATLGDLREAVHTLEEIEPNARRVLGGSHPTTEAIEGSLRDTRAALRARETPRSVGVEDDDDDEDGWETVSSDEEAPTTEAIP